MKKIYLSRTDKKIFGVCGGIGQAYEIDPSYHGLFMYSNRDFADAGHLHRGVVYCAIRTKKLNEHRLSHL